MVCSNIGFCPFILWRNPAFEAAPTQIYLYTFIYEEVYTSREWRPSMKLNIGHPLKQDEETGNK